MENYKVINDQPQNNPLVKRPFCNVSNDLRSIELSRQWLRALRGFFSDVRLFPVVYAAPSPPEKPQPMSSKDLPIYQSPHRTYNEYVKSKEYECAEPSEPVQNALQPAVKTVRVAVQGIYKKQKECAKDCFNKTVKNISGTMDSTVQFFRDDKNEAVRKAAVSAGGIAGFFFSIKNGFLVRLINITMGATAMGALCFPKETDQTVREVGVTVKDTLNSIYYAVNGVLLFRESRSCACVDPCREDEKDKKCTST